MEKVPLVGSFEPRPQRAISEFPSRKHFRASTIVVPQSSLRTFASLILRFRRFYIIQPFWKIFPSTYHRDVPRMIGRKVGKIWFLLTGDKRSHGGDSLASMDLEWCLNGRGNTRVAVTCIKRDYALERAPPWDAWFTRFVFSRGKPSYTGRMHALSRCMLIIPQNLHER